MKKINSEIKISDNPLFNIKIGTTDKKKYDVIYIEGKCYITPVLATIPKDFSENIKKIEEELKKFIRGVFFARSSYTEKIFDEFSPLIIFDVAEDRATIGKETCFTIQIYYKRKFDAFNEFSDGFKRYAEFIPSKELNSLSTMANVKDIFDKNGFIITKKVKSRKNA